MPSNIPTLPSKNLAPLEPLFGLKEGKSNTPVYICDGLKELIQDLLERDKTTYEELARTAQMISNFIQGKQIWQPNYWTGNWAIHSVQRVDPNRISAINIMQFYCTSQIKMIISSNPDIEPYPEFKGKEHKDKVKMAKAVWNYYERRFYSQWFLQQQALHAIITGWYGESIEYDHLKTGAKVFKEVLGEKELEISPGFSRCFSPNCGYEGAYKDFVGDGTKIPNCPMCGGVEILPPEPPIIEKYKSVIGVQPIETGDLTLKLKSILNFRFDLKNRAEESSWSITRHVMPRRKLEYMLGIKIPASDPVQDEGLKALEEIARAGNTLSGLKSQTSNAQSSDDIVVDKICLMPEDVSHIINRKAEKTIDGGSIPEGAKLSDLCPNGMTVYAINDGGTILAIFPDIHHRNELSTGVYHMRWQSGLGRGSDDTLEVQKRFNRFDAQTVKYLETAATPAHTYVKGSVDRNHVKKIGHPAAIIPINQEVAMALGTTDLVKSIPVGNISGNLFQYTYDILNQFRQLTSHVTDFTNAFPGVDNRTATGAQLAKTNADSIYAPMLMLKADVRVSTAQKTLRNYKKHFQGVSRVFALGETTSGQTLTSTIKGEDIDTEIMFTAVRNSEQPKTMYDRQVDFVNMLTSAGQAGGYPMLKQTDPKLAQALLKAFDIDLDDNTYDTTVDVCEERLEQALSLREQIAQAEALMGEMTGMIMPPSPPEMILLGLSPTIEIEEPNHELKAKWFSDFLDSPEGMKLSNEDRAIVRMLVRTHYQFAVMQMGMLQQGYTQAGMMGAAPMTEQEDRRAQEEREFSAQEEDKKRAADLESADREDARMAFQADREDRMRIEDRKNQVYDAQQDRSFNRELAAMKNKASSK